MSVTAVLNAHREGMLLGPSLFSLLSSAKEARAQRVAIDVLYVLDRPDDVTRGVIRTFQNRYGGTLLEVDFGDLGRSRNAAVEASDTKWVAFLDGDDLWGRNWLSEAYASAEADPRTVVWHPEVNLYFGEYPHLFRHPDMEDGSYTHLKLCAENQWTALCFAPRSLLLEVPYPQSDIERGIGYEDWSWHLETVSKGILHKVVTGTGHAIRRQEVSLVRKTNAARCLPKPTGLFREILEQREYG